MSRSFYVDSLILKPAATPPTPPGAEGRLHLPGVSDGRLHLPHGFSLFPGGGFPRPDAFRHIAPFGLERSELVQDDF
jgi:hypothetical protein